MWKSDIICSECGAGYRRIEIASVKRAKGEYRAKYAGMSFDGTFEVLSVSRCHPSKPTDALPRKPIELPPAIARAFVRDMNAFFADKNQMKVDEIAIRQLVAE
jgi:hypothetical protein